MRRPKSDEERLLRHLWAKCKPSPRVTVADLAVEDMEDGGMGSLRLHYEGQPRQVDTGVFVLADCSFHDADGVLVYASILASRDDVPRELDIWKVDYSPLRRIGETFGDGPRVVPAKGPASK